MTENKRLSRKALNTLTKTAVEQYRLSGLDGDESVTSLREGLAALVVAGAADEAALAAFEAAVAAERRDTELDAPLPEETLKPPSKAVQKELIGALLQSCTEEDRRTWLAAKYLTDFWALPTESQVPASVGGSQ